MSVLREGQEFKVLENRVERKIHGSKREEVTEECRKLHNEKLHVYGLAHCSVRTRRQDGERNVCRG